MSNYYKGEKGCLRYISDILDDCDGCNTVKSMTELIKEARAIAIKGIVDGENFDVSMKNGNEK